MTKEELVLKNKLDKRRSNILKQLKYKNRCFGTGEEGILEQASMILHKKKRPYYSLEHTSKRLILIHCEGNNDKKW